MPPAPRICLVPNCAFLSETSRMLAIGEALREQGASVVMATHGGPYESQLRNANVAFEHLEPVMDAARSAAFVRSLPGMEGSDGELYTPSELRASVDSEVRFFRDQSVDAVITGFTLSTLLSTRVAAIPLVTSHAGSWVPPILERRMAPVPVDARPPITWLPESWLRSLIGALTPRTKRFCGAHNAVAKELGVEGLPSFVAMMLGDLTLVTDVPEVLGIPREELEAWTPNPRFYRAGTRLRYVGPLFAELPIPVSERVERFLAEGSRPVVLVSINSSKPGLVRDVIQRVVEVPARVLVASTVHDLASSASDHVCVEPILPNHRIMPRVDAAVTAGGQGTVQTAMASGIPLVGIPLQPEQDFNVHEMERHGAALRMSLSRANSSDMTSAVRTVLGASFRQAAKRVEQHYVAVDGKRQAAREILAYLRDVRPAARQSA